MLLLMFSLAGIPRRWVLREARGAAGRARRGQVWLAVVAVLFALIGTIYYIRS